MRENLLPPYNALSIDGKVEGELVFVNYGMPQDYEILDRYGIDVKGKIAIAKYGKSWRGIKPKLAGEKGAIATIFIQIQPMMVMEWAMYIQKAHLKMTAQYSVVQ